MMTLTVHPEDFPRKHSFVHASLFWLLAAAAVLLPPPAAAQTFTEIYPFNTTSDLADGGYPEAGVAVDANGNLYGTAFFGGTGAGCDIYFNGCGVVYQVAPGGTETVLHSFGGALDGWNPTANLVLDAKGNLYGTTPYGGAYGNGSVFEVNAAGQETILHSFAGGSDGARPNAGLTWDSSGNLYGTTQYGGNGCSSNAHGCGTVFEISSAAQETVLYAFADGIDGASPLSGVALDSAGNIYGTTWLGGTYNFGTVFEIDHGGGERVLYSFAGGNDGANPIGGLVFDLAGNLYGITPAGGADTCGVIFEVDVAGDEEVIYTFTGGLDGADPYATLIVDASGNLYGTTPAGGVGGAGTVFEFSGGSLNVLYGFSGTYDGSTPMGSLARDAAGNLYGTAVQGGTNGWGDVFEIQLDGNHSHVDTVVGARASVYREFRR